MSSINVAFSRELLSTILTDVRAFSPLIKVSEAWVYKVGKDHWEFHFNDYYWHGSADNAFDARAKGWEAWLCKNNAPGYSRDHASGEPVIEISQTGRFLNATATAPTGLSWGGLHQIVESWRIPEKASADTIEHIRQSLRERVIGMGALTSCPADCECHE